MQDLGNIGKAPRIVIEFDQHGSPMVKPEGPVTVPHLAMSGFILQRMANVLADRAEDAARREAQVIANAMRAPRRSD